MQKRIRCCGGFYFTRALRQLRCIKERIDFAIIGNQSEIDFFLVLVMRTTTLVFNAVFLFLRISRIFAIAPLSSLLIFSVIDFMCVRIATLFISGPEKSIWAYVLIVGRNIYFRIS